MGDARSVMTPPVLRDDYLNTPILRRLQGSHPRFAEIMSRHASAVAARLPCYQDPVSGLSVMTAEFWHREIIVVRADVVTAHM